MNIIIPKISTKRMYTKLMSRGRNEVWGKGDGNETIKYTQPIQRRQERRERKNSDANR